MSAPSKTTRALVALEQEGRCLFCYEEKPLTLDHIQMQCNGGRHGRENLRGLCLDCHTELSAVANYNPRQRPLHVRLFLALAALVGPESLTLHWVFMEAFRLSDKLSKPNWLGRKIAYIRRQDNRLVGALEVFGFGRLNTHKYVTLTNGRKREVRMFRRSLSPKTGVAA